MSADVWSLIDGKRVLFITTKSLDYIRNSQEIALLKSRASAVEVLGEKGGSYPLRLLKIYPKLLFKPLKDFDIIFIGFAPQLVLPFFGHRFRNKTVVIDFFISMYDTLVCDRQKFKPGSFIGRILHTFDRKTVAKADRLICDTNAHGEYFHEEFGVPTDKLSTLYLEADRSIYRPMPGAKPEIFKNRFIVHYFGSILPLQGIETILEAARLLKDEKEILFDLVGPLPEELGAANRDLKSLLLTPWLPQQQLAERIAAADLCLAGHFNAQISKASRTIPGKATIYEAMGKPMILGENPANHERFAPDDRHFFVPMGDAEALAAMVKELRRRLPPQQETDCAEEG